MNLKNKEMILEELKRLYEKRNNSTLTSDEELLIIQLEETLKGFEKNEIENDKSLTNEEMEIKERCTKLYFELKNSEIYEEHKEDFDKIKEFIDNVHNKNKDEKRLAQLLYAQNVLLKYYDILNNKEELKKLDKKEKESNKLLNTLKSKVVPFVLIASLLGIGAYAINKTSKNNNIKLDNNFDKASYEFFINNGVRENDAASLAANSTKIMEILGSNTNGDIKVNKIDDLLLGIYNDENNIENISTYLEIGNAASVDVYNNHMGVVGYEDINEEKCANVLDVYSYLDINDESTFDTINENLVSVMKAFYLNPTKENAQNLIDTIYLNNIESGFLNEVQEGLIAEFVLGPGGAVLVKYGELTVSESLTNNKITANELINELVARIEVFEREAAYSRSIN